MSLYDSDLKPEKMVISKESSISSMKIESNDSEYDAEFERKTMWVEFP